MLVRSSKVLGLSIALSLALAATTVLLARSVLADSKSSAQQEKTDRLVDRAALGEMSKAVASIEKQLKRCRQLKLGADREEQLLFKLGDLRYQRAEIEFRVSMHQRSDNRYRKSLQETIGTLTELAKRFPNTDEMPRLLWIRARAFEDLELKKEAEADYLRITGDFKEFEQINSARMALGRLRMDRNNYLKAIEAMEPIRSQPEAAQYAYALQQIAWCYYNLEQTDAAIRASLDGIEQLRRKTTGSVDQSMIDQLTQDIATFYGDAIERDPSHFTYTGAWELLTRIHPKVSSNEPGSFPAAAARMGKLLRSKALSAQLKGWSALLWKHYPTLGTTVVVDHLLREFADNNKDWDTVLERRDPTGFESEAWESHRKLYTQVQNRIQELLKKNPEAPPEKTLPWLEKLGRAYEAYLAVTPAAAGAKLDPRQFQAELQLLKTELAILEQKKLRKKFEVLRKQPLQKPLLIKAYASVLARMDRLADQIPEDQSGPLQLERSKMLYEQGQIEEALNGFQNLVDNKGGTGEARTALAALLDQAIADEDRARLELLLARRNSFKSDAQAVTLLDKAELQHDILVLKSPVGAEKEAAVDRLLGRIAAKQDLPVELSDYVITEKASLLRAQAGPEANGRILELLSKLSRPEKQEGLILLLAFAQGRASDWISHKGFCAEKSASAELCTQLKYLPLLEQAPAKSSASGLVRSLLKSSTGPERTLIALRLLIHAQQIGSKDLGLKDRSVVLRAIAKGWKDLHPVLQWQMLPRWLKHSSEMLAINTQSLRQGSPLQPTEAHLIHRMDLIKSYENLSKDIQAMGIYESSIAALEAHARILSDFSEDLKPIPPLVPQLNAGVANQVAGLTKLIEEQKLQLQKTLAEAEPRLRALPTWGMSAFDSSKLASQVWAFANPEKDQQKRNVWIVKILWAQGARHAASQMASQIRLDAPAG